jgi:hypothetical protein
LHKYTNLWQESLPFYGPRSPQQVAQAHWHLQSRWDVTLMFLIDEGLGGYGTWGCVPGVGWPVEWETATCSPGGHRSTCNCVNWLQCVMLTLNQRIYFADFMSLDLLTLPSPLRGSEFWTISTRKPCSSENCL